jgi:hypothetical protein
MHPTGSITVSVGDMPQRGQAPGLKWGRQKKGADRPLPYWYAAQVRRELHGFRDKCIPLPPEADAETLAQLCRQYTARLLSYLDDIERETPQGRLPSYDGTILSLSRIFQLHPVSPFSEVKHNTQRTYAQTLKLIEADIGNWRPRQFNALDAKYWYREWRKPGAPGGAERKKRAKDAIDMLKALAKFGETMGSDDCAEMYARVKHLRFEKSGVRQQEMTAVHVAAYVRSTLERGRSGIIPERRAYSLAIGLRAQFDLALRQKDVIGEWRPADPGVPDAIYHSDEMWTGQFRWDKLPGWRLRLRTSKTKRVAIWDLHDSPHLLELLESVPMEWRIGGIIADEHGLPICERSYRKWYRENARAAGIPDEIWSMDSRAGAATEASEAGADLKAISDMLTHSEQRTTLRYIRRNEQTISDALRARSRKRASDGDGTA